MSSMDGGSGGGKGGMMGGSPSGMSSMDGGSGGKGVDGGSSGKGSVVLDTTGTAAFYGSFVTTGRSTFLPNSIVHMSVFA